MSRSTSKIEIRKTSSPTDIDTLGFKARLGSLNESPNRKPENIRDCIIILGPSGEISLGLVTRPEDVNATFLEGLLREGEGVLDIDGGRVGTDENTSRTNGTHFSAGNTGASREGNSGGNDQGRFPANLILKHGNDCYCDGTRKVKGGNSNLGVVHGTGGGTAHQDNQKSKGSGQVYARAWDPHGQKGKQGYTSEDGTEEVPNWICEPTCPVRILDSQSGVLKSGYLSPDHNVKETTGWSGGSQADRVKQTFEPSEGGASRFFKQVQSEDELDKYLNRLIKK